MFSTVQMSILKLPRELLDMTLDHLESDKPKHSKRSLAACAAVCHTWCIAARPRLFHAIKVVFGKPGRRWPTVSSFREFLDSESGFSGISPLVKKLVLIAHNPSDPYYYFHLSAFELDRILLRLPAVTTLHLEGARLKHSLSVVNGWAMPRSLDELRLVSVDFELCRPALSSERLEYLVKPSAAMCGLVQVLNLFQRVQYLHLDSIKITWAHRKYAAVLPADGKKIASQLAVDRLYTLMYGIDHAATFEVLAASHLLPLLSELSIGSSTSICNTAMRAVGPHLAHLSLTLHHNHLYFGPIRCEDVVRFWSYHLPVLSWLMLLCSFSMRSLRARVYNPCISK